MSIFDRLGRIARSEFNDLKRKITGSDDDEAGDGAEDGGPKARSGETVEIDDPAQPVAADWPAQTWPREIRQSYAALELPLGSDEEAVRRQYRALLKRYHPDKHAGDPQRAATANELSAALGQHRDALLTYLKATSG